MDSPNINSTTKIKPEDIKPKRFPLGKVIVFIVVLALIAGYIIYRNEISYYMYELGVKNQPSFKDQQVNLKKAYLNAKGNPDNLQAVLELGLVQTALKDYDSAAENFKKVLQMEPANMTANQNIVRVYEYKQDYQAAEEHAKKYMEVSGGLSDPYTVLADLYTNHYSEKSDQLDNLYKTAFEKTKDPQFLLLRAGYFAQKKEYSKAVGEIEKWLSDSNNTKEENNRKLVESLLEQYKLAQ